MLAIAGIVPLVFNTTDNSESVNLLPDSAGKIRLAVVSVNSARSSTLRNATLTSTIINALPPHVKFIILAPDRKAFTVLSNPEPDRVTFVNLPEKQSLTIWPQDPFLVLQNASSTRLLVSREFDRAEDIKMAENVARHLGLQAEKSELLFEGGNIVSDRRHVFIGANTIRYNAIDKELPEIEIARRFKQLLGRDVIVIGPAPQVIGHIDMMLTPIGDQHLLLADPEWGASLAERDLENAPGKVTEFEKNCEKYFFGHPAITELKSSDGASIVSPPISGTTKHAIQDSRDIGPAMDQVAEELRQLGFKVSRIPFLYRTPDISAPDVNDKSSTSKPGYPQLTFNNVLIETTLILK